MNKKIFFLDASALIALSNINPSEDTIRKKIESFIDNEQPYSIHTTIPCMVEFFYKVNKSKKLTSQNVQTTMDHYGAVTFHTSDIKSQDILNKYLSITYKNPFDFADFFLCNVVLQFPKSCILESARKNKRQSFIFYLTDTLLGRNLKDRD